MAVSISICNLALGDIRASAIAEISDDNVEAQNCARYYPQCLSLLLDDYTWSFATRIATLAQLATNDRKTEWTYAYALPSDCASAMRLLPSVNSSVTTGAYNWPYDIPINPLRLMDFVIEDGKLYTHISGAVLEYSVNTLEEVAMTPLFREALRKLLAANLAIPILNSREAKGDLLQEAQFARQAAIASDMNRQPNRDNLDEVAWARR